jgi:hypothetical protein
VRRAKHAGRLVAYYCITVFRQSAQAHRALLLPDDPIIVLELDALAELLLAHPPDRPLVRCQWKRTWRHLDRTPLLTHSFETHFGDRDFLF